jgi:hypothetical protein
MRFIIVRTNQTIPHLDSPEWGKNLKTQIYTSKGSFFLEGPIGKEWTHYRRFSRRRYKTVYDNYDTSLNKGKPCGYLQQPSSITRFRTEYFSKIEVTKHYNSFEEFVEDRIELFL